MPPGAAHARSSPGTFGNAAQQHTPCFGPQAPTTDSWGVVTEDTFKALGAMVLSGPLLCGFTQTCNDWFDRDLDAINEPYRPIPSGAISQNEVYFQIGALLVGGLALAFQLDGWAENDWPVLTFLAVLGSAVAWIYSAPPLKLKANGWTGTYALGSSYIALPWWCGSRQAGVGQRWGQASLSGPGLVACT